MLSRHDGWCAQQPVVSGRVRQPVLNAGGSVQAVHGRLSGCCCSKIAEAFWLLCVASMFVCVC